MCKTVSAVVWPWRAREAESALPREARPLRKAAAIQAAVMAALGSGLFWWLGHRIMGIVAWGLAGIVLISGFFIPSFFAAIERFGKRLGARSGEILTWGLLAPFYYLCFFPMHLVLKLKGKDPLHRQFRADLPTYWVPHKPIQDPSRYRKQF